MSAPLPAIPEGVPKQGDVIAGKYRVEGVLGAGGMGIVVSALHIALGQRVAVTLLSPTAQQVFPDAGARFLREARSAMAATSEHVTRGLDVRELDGGSPYIVMELLARAGVRSHGHGRWARRPAGTTLRTPRTPDALYSSRRRSRQGIGYTSESPATHISSNVLPSP
ncbi:hypothetical protein WMF31_22660 [Sorangium sp. So ce1036]|uniref:hypothetical protein n=1 Tax=Sorangium sp. So ce1036 TaxID=3133328 RepID=UPI003F0CDDD8